ncbi:MAG: HAD hydrolase-like protein [Pseudoprimorskyibacter sp.]|nr:HAD hydrolase-like protein [Pseudoprimorskyibacter sp.]
MLTTQSIFNRYEEVRSRLPKAHCPGPSTQISSLLDIADQVGAFVFDAFGVLNVGETMIIGADKRVEQLRERGCEIRILTNAASYNRSEAKSKFERLGIRVEASEIITSRDATLQNLGVGRLGVITSDEDTLSDLQSSITRLHDNADDYDRVDSILFLSASGWTEKRQDLLVRTMRRRPRKLLIGNADLAAPRDDGFSAEPGHFGHEIADMFPEHVQFFGKPFPEVYDILEASLPPMPRDQIVMCGDTLHTDILGAAARGWGTVLVTEDGLFAGHSTQSFSAQSRIFADWILKRI